jgi:PKD repeat protein
MSRLHLLALVLGLACPQGIATAQPAPSPLPLPDARLQHALHRLTQPGPPSTASALTAATWAFTYGGSADDSATLVDHTSDGGLVFSGTTKSFGAGGTDLWLFKLDSAGNVLWQKTYGTTYDDYGSVLPATGGGYIAEGFSAMGNGQNQFWAARLDAGGSILWQKAYGAAGSGLLGLMPVTGGYLIFGRSLNFVTFAAVLKLVKIDANGTIVWQKEYTSSDQRWGIPLELSDGSFIVGGSAYSLETEDNDLWVAKLSSTGDVQWQYTYGGTENEIGTAAMPTSDGGFILEGQTLSWTAGTGEEERGDFWLLKLSSSGAIQWQKAYGGPGEDEATASPTADGAYLLSGLTSSFGAGGEDAWAAKLDGSGKIVWQRTYGGTGDDFGFAFPDTQGGYFLIGDTGSFGAVNSESWILKLDSNGAIVWQHTYGGGGTADSVDPERMSDGSIILTGTTNSYGAGGIDTVGARLDSTGKVAGSCPFIHDTSATVGTPAMTVTTTTAVGVAVTSTVTGGTITATAYSLGTSSSTVAPHDLCSATAQLSASASADQTSGSAPLTVHFTGSATGGTAPYTWEWDFGDGSAHATEQSPTHSYTANGSFAVTLTVRDSAAHSATDTHLHVVLGGSGCTISCTATVPGSATPGTAVQFTSTVTPSGCTGSTMVIWDFGDGSISQESSPTHAYSDPGSYDWSFTAILGTATCSRSGTITIGSESVFSAWVPSVAHAGGAGGSQWRTNVAAANRNSTSASITLTYLPYDGSASTQRTASLAPSATTEWADILSSLFGLDTGKGTVKVAADVPLYVTSRTYNQASSGTFGQGYPAVMEADVIPEGQVGVLPQLKNNADFRTNIGVQNIGSAGTNVEVKLFGPSGAQVGQTQSKTVSPGLYWQWDKIFETAGAGNRDIAYATVQARTAGARIWVYASVVDNKTGDPTTVPVLWGGGARALFVGSVAHAAGSGGSAWRTNVAVVNRSASPATLTVTYLPYTGATPKVKTATLAAGATHEWTDILVSLFGLTDGKGTVQISSTQPLFATSRTYNQATSGTFGQSYPALAETHAIAAGKIGVIPQLTNNSSFRTNLGVQNMGTATASVEVKLFASNGAQVGSAITLSPTAGHYVQQDKILDAAGAGTRALAYATVEVKTSGAKVWAYASVVDNNTGDPTTVSVLVQ